MPRAGFYPIGASQIAFRRDGHWYADGERITNQRIALLFSRHLVERPDGTYALVMGDEKAPVDVEATPWVITEIDGDPEHGFTVTLNDETREPLRPASLHVEDDDAFSCEVKAGTRARFLRAAHHALARYVETAGAPGQFVLKVRGHRHLLAPGGRQPTRRGDPT